MSRIIKAIGGIAMGLFETNDNTLTGNSIMVGDMVITWDNHEDTEPESVLNTETPVEKPRSI
jgi:hypothetical protein